ncbi:MAG TPA: hypothetical protein VLE95_01280 [Chlamydiales bacterium]|nr:hypothetical protein [Chlamydiales bacterium]
MNLSTLNRSAAEIAALALYETFPGIELLGGKRTSLGFSFDVRASIEFPSETEILIEEKMRQIVRENRAMRILEMVPFSARELLLKEGHLLQADAIGEGEGLIEIVQIGAFYALSSGPHLVSTFQLGPFKLWPIQKVGGGVLRLSGCAFPSRAELKNFLKRLREYPNASHERIGVKKSLWIFLDGRIIWLKNGLKECGNVIQILREHLFEGAEEVRLSDQSMKTRLAKEMGRDRIAEIDFSPPSVWDAETGLFAGIGGAQVSVHFYASQDNWQQIVNSSLQSVIKTLNILGFRHRLFLHGGRKTKGSVPRTVKGMRSLQQAIAAQGIKLELAPEEGEESARLDFLVEDALGRPWAAFSIELAATGVFIKASVERLVALLIEMAK